MKLLRTLGALLLAGCALPAAAQQGEAPCQRLDCLICPEANDPRQYEGRSMKFMRFLTPGSETWLFRSSVDLVNEFGIPTPMQGEFARLMRAFAAHGTQVLVAVQPTRGLIHHDKVRPEHAHGFDFARASASFRGLQAQLAAGGAIVPDMMQLVERPPAGEYFFRRDSHWTPAGAEATARVVADAVRQLPLYAELPKTRYRTEPGVIIPKNGTLDISLDQLCGTSYGYQYVQNYRTVPAAEDASALFGEAPEPKVVLVGTSNSAARDDETRQYNFDGYLKQFLETDILNFAIAGAGQDGSLLEYLLSDEYSPDDPPRLIIWELPASYTLSEPYLFRQLIPAANGGCARGRTLLEQVHPASQPQPGERLEVLSNAGDTRQALQGLDGFLQLDVSDATLKDFYVITYYDNGARDKVLLRRQAAVKGGRYYLELSRDPALRQANLLSVFIEPTLPQAQPTRVEARLCQ